MRERVGLPILREGVVANDPGVLELRARELAVSLGNDVVDQIGDAAQLEELVATAVKHLVHRVLNELGPAARTPRVARACLDTHQLSAHGLPVRRRAQHLTTRVVEWLELDRAWLAIRAQRQRNAKAAARLVLILCDGDIQLRRQLPTILCGQPHTVGIARDAPLPFARAAHVLLLVLLVPECDLVDRNRLE
eukprot:7383121-Prymnesium_polylepis.1